jgi:hypothetical protein
MVVMLELPKVIALLAVAVAGAALYPMMMLLLPVVRV